jgi:hypothetical protein
MILAIISSPILMKPTGTLTVRYFWKKPSALLKKEGYSVGNIDSTCLPREETQNCPLFVT